MSCEELRQVLLGHIADAEQDVINDRPLLPVCRATVDCINQQPVCHDIVVALLGDLIMGTAPGPWELTAFCIHELRWPELQRCVDAELERAVRSNDWRAIAVLTSYRDAFLDDWDDVDLFLDEK